MKKLKMVFKYDEIPGQIILKLLLDVFNESGYSKQFYIHDRKSSEKRILSKIEEKERWPTGVTTDQFIFGYGGVADKLQSFFEIREKSSSTVSNWDVWIEKFLKTDSFLQGWISDIAYDYWQNADDPREFSSVGREYQHLPMKSNGLPYPLERQIIDTSKNPGRWEFRMGYLEAIGSTMWLGEHFWNYVGQDKRQKLFNESWIRTEVLENGVVKLVAADECFMDESTADKQNRLREILYGSEQ